MAFNGSGLFNIDSTGQPVSANTLIESADFNALTADLATGLSNCVTKDGQQTITANLPMASFRHTGVGNAAARTDYAAAGQVQDGKLNWVDGGGTADAITATYSPAITTLVDGQLCCVRATAANATTTPTFAPNGLTARTIVKKGGAALVAGDIVADGHELILRYDLSNTRWELLNPGSYAGTGANTFTGAQLIQAAATQDAVEIAGRAGGTSSYKVTLTPTTLTASRTATLPDETFDVGFRNIPQNSQSTAYTAVLADSGKHLLHPSADTTARTFTIPANSSVAYPIGTAITFVNQASAGVMTIAITTDTMRLAGAGTTGSRTLAANGIATALKLTSTEWIISGTGLT